ncbi:hypothetical protein HYPSUDRAFT_54489 [Hypholoma sublateritium FD-334 SS-4]|uniref:Uncharacterized protein n=1 Tax=Hypholoma sublateritium (strain FD-334 SS-4) TaxID=945553 RepID=A0A0D2P3R4_HYPSF|nr:hypothetical protein HYPSUDRAFT_54489 [Hypholoma sublateritium FD-334 SS-4]
MYASHTASRGTPCTHAHARRMPAATDPLANVIPLPSELYYAAHPARRLGDIKPYPPPSGTLHTAPRTDISARNRVAPPGVTGSLTRRVYFCGAGAGGGHYKDTTEIPWAIASPGTRSRFARRRSRELSHREGERDWGLHDSGAGRQARRHPVERAS